MKKLLIYLSVSLISIISYSQAFIGVQINSMGAGLNLGIEVNNVSVIAGYNMPFLKATMPGLYYLETGYTYKFTEQEPFSVSMYAGAAAAQSKIILKDNTTLDNNRVVPIVNLEIGKDWNTGRLFVTCGYATKLYYGVGIKAFF